MNSSKENRHPNRPRVQEEDIRKISKQYILQGQCLKVKGYFDCENRRQKVEVLEKKEQEPGRALEPQSLDPELYYRLEYLEKMGALNQEQQEMLQEMRSMNQQYLTNTGLQKQSRTASLGMRINNLGFLPQHNIQNFNPYLVPQEMVSSSQRSFSKQPYMQQANYHYLGHGSSYDAEEYY